MTQAGSDYILVAMWVGLWILDNVHYCLPFVDSSCI